MKQKSQAGNQKEEKFVNLDPSQSSLLSKLIQEELALFFVRKKLLIEKKNVAARKVFW